MSSFPGDRLHVRPGGVEFAVNLTKPVAADATPTADRFKVRCCHYEYSSSYGCPEQDVRNIAVEQVDVSEDRRRILLAFPVEKHPLEMAYAFDFHCPASFCPAQPH